MVKKPFGELLTLDNAQHFLQRNTSFGKGF
nr:MAG TPA: hypothetical protein [Caudoviricetes sp.]